MCSAGKTGICIHGQPGMRAAGPLFWRCVEAAKTGFTGTARRMEFLPADLTKRDRFSIIYNICIYHQLTRAGSVLPLSIGDNRSF